ncbi:MAG: c-type cytochrome [Ignavibacteriales bacterium]|nr:c-type cytochrome [Ignavibacteriales bacterium]
MPLSSDIFEKAPSLSYAGLRYNPGYLFAYLGNPQSIRKHIDRRRMPDFFLDERERLALTLFLSGQKTLPRPPLRFPIELTYPQPLTKSYDPTKLIVEELQCTACHKMAGTGADVAVDLASIGARLNTGWLAQYLAMPQAFDLLSPMPAQAYTLSQHGSKLEEVIPNAGEKIRAMAHYLTELGKEERLRLKADFEKSKKSNRDITPQLGERIFSSLNCAGCHELGAKRPWKNGPDLRKEASRVKKEWLVSYLQEPKPIRPFGFIPGTGSRMPDYSLKPDEAAEVVAFLFQQPDSFHTSVTSASLSPFSQRKTEILLREQLPCLGCHQLNGEGGKVAPDLSGVAQRLKPEFLISMIRDPQHSVPGTMMPETPMGETTSQLLVSYFVSRENVSDTTRYLSLTNFQLIPHSEGSEPSQLYARFCSACHGEEGRSDGFNARFLPTKPSSLSSKSLMSPRADDTIFDGIHNGGAILGKSPRMPMFGETLSREQIWMLVKYIRQMCKCEGPTWSRAGVK